MTKMKRLQFGAPSRIQLITTLFLSTVIVAQAEFIDVQDRPSGHHHHHPVASFHIGAARYTKVGNVETFEELDSSCGRIEHSFDVSYKTGHHIFTGDIKIITVSGTIVVQLFNAAHSGPTLFLKASPSLGGNLKKYGNGPVVAQGVLNKWVSVKIDHNLDKNSLAVYINGVKKWSGGASKNDFSGGFKYGTYGGTSRPVKVQWRNARLQ